MHCVDSFYTLSVDKNRHFLTPSPPHLVHVVIEWPLLRHMILNKCSTKLISETRELVAQFG